MGGLRFLVTSGICIGENQLKPKMQNDNVKILREILDLAKAEAHFLFIAGNLFSSSKPSNKSIATVFNSFKKEVLGEKRTQIVVEGVSTNLTNKNVSTSLPIFLIHGKTDIPAEDEDLISSLDILSQAGFANYIGRKRDFDFLEIRPMLIQHEEESVAIYTLGHINELLLSKLLNQKKIVFVDPWKEQNVPNPPKKILILHQKRSRKDNPNFSYPIEEIHPGLFPNIFDLIIWGGENNQLKLQTQQGRTVYSPGNASVTDYEIDKDEKRSVGLIQIEKGNIKIEPIILSSPRPIIYRKLYLNEYDSQIKSKHKNMTYEYCLENEINFRLNSFFTEVGEYENLPIVRYDVISPSHVYIDTTPIENKILELVANEGEVINVLKRWKKPQKKIFDPTPLESLIENKLKKRSWMGTISTDAVQEKIREDVVSIGYKSPFIENILSSFENSLEDPGLVQALTQNLESRLELALDQEGIKKVEAEGSNFLGETKRFLDNFDVLGEDKDYLDDILGKMKGRFDNFHQIHAKASKFVQEERLKMLKEKINLEDLEKVEIEEISGDTVVELEETDMELDSNAHRIDSSIKKPNGNGNFDLKQKNLYKEKVGIQKENIVENLKRKINFYNCGINSPVIEGLSKKNLISVEDKNSKNEAEPSSPKIPLIDEDILAEIEEHFDQISREHKEKQKVQNLGKRTPIDLIPQMLDEIQNEEESEEYCPTPLYQSKSPEAEINLKTQKNYMEENKDLATTPKTNMKGRENSEEDIEEISDFGYDVENNRIKKRKSLETELKNSNREKILRSRKKIKNNFL